MWAMTAYGPGAAVVNSINSFSPAWDPDGEFLYFLSDRNLNTLVSSPWGPRAPGPFFDRENEIFHVSLRPGLRSPFKPDDELTPAETPEEEGQGADRSGQSRATSSGGSVRGGGQAAAPEPIEIEMAETCSWPNGR